MSRMGHRRHRGPARSARARFAARCCADRTYASARRYRPRTSRRSRPPPRVLACPCRRDIRCSSAPEYSCSDRTRQQGGHSRGKRPCLPEMPPTRSWWHGRAHNRKRCDDARNRRSPAHAPSPALSSRTGSRRLPRAGRSAISAAQQVHQRIRRQVLHRMLSRGSNNRIRQAVVANDAIGRQTHPASRSNDAAAPITEAVAIREDRHDRICDEMIGDNNVRRAREVRTQHHDHRCRLREIVQHFESDADLHSNCLPVCSFQMATKPQDTRRDCLIRSNAFHNGRKRWLFAGKRAP